MKVVDRKPVPIYEAECSECHSKIEYKASEVSYTGYITCPVCGSSVWGSKCYPVRMDESTMGQLKDKYAINERRTEMKNTVIYTIEVTDITTAYPRDEHLPVLTKAFKDTLDADDVVITKVQVFEGSDEE